MTQPRRTQPRRTQPRRTQPRSKFSIRSLFLFVFGIAAIMTLVFPSNPTTRLMGWGGLGVYLLVRRQQTLFWLHVCIPLGMGMMAIVTSAEDPWGAAIPKAGSWAHFFHFVGEAGMFLALITYPFSFLAIDR